MNKAMALAVALFLASPNVRLAEAQSAAPSVAPALQAVAEKVHALESTPLSSESQKKRSELFAWLVESPDVSIKWCAGILLDAPKSDKDTKGQLLIQAILSAGAFAIEHPESADDGLLVARAGLRGALKTYQATVAAEPKHASKFFDALVDLESKGNLDDYLTPKMKDCK